MPSEYDLGALLQEAEESRLRYFRLFLPLYAESVHPGTGKIFTDGVLARLLPLYYSERGMNLQPLVEGANTLAVALAGAGRPRQEEQLAKIRALPQSWSGSRGAAAAQQSLGKFASRVRADVSYAGELPGRMRLVADSLKGFVTTKLKILPVRDTVFGETEADVKDIIRTAKGLRKGHRQYAWRGVNVPVPGMSAPEVATHWLEHTFRADVDENLKLFELQCQITRTLVGGMYQSFADLLRLADDGAYPAVPERRTLDDSGSGQHTGPATRTNGPPAGPGTRNPPPSGGSGVPPPHVPPGTAPATAQPGPPVNPGASSALAGMGSVVQALGKPLTDGIGQAVTAATGLGNTLAPPPAVGSGHPAGPHAPPGQPGHTVAEYAALGNHVKLQQAANGALSMHVTNPDGVTHSYRVRIDEHGKPMIETAVGPPGAKRRDESDQEQDPKRKGAELTARAEPRPASDPRPADEHSPATPAPVASAPPPTPSANLAPAPGLVSPPPPIAEPSGPQLASQTNAPPVVTAPVAPAPLRHEEEQLRRPKTPAAGTPRLASSDKNA